MTEDEYYEWFRLCGYDRTGAGTEITEEMTNKSGYSALGRLDPIEDGIWDIRCREKPGLRVFCFFLERNVLLATFCRPRAVRVWWIDWLPLVDMVQWTLGKISAKRLWTMHFPAESPMIGDTANDYLTNASPE